MKTLFLLIFICIINFAQQDSINRKGSESVQIIGGIDALQTRLVYPIDAIENDIEGNVIVFVTIDTSGIPMNPIVIKGLGYGCDEEAIRLVLTSKFLPFVINSNKLKSQINIRVKFKLPKEE